MREDLEQQEQMAALRAFWASNRKWITSILILLTIISVSTTIWKYYKDTKLAKASELLASAEQAIGNQKISDAILITKELSENYSLYLHRGLAGLMLAKALVFDDRKKEAESELRDLINHNDVGISWVARIRLAGLLLDMNKPVDALDVLPEEIPDNWISIASDRRGDVLMVLGRKEAARKAWLKALNSYDEEGIGGLAGKMIRRKIATIDSLQISKETGARQ
ncbi:MAG: hypothetical protein CBD16_00745 [Betaproteobacteria bacterium TMED156]|nr:MAG: hypothetical protein CBD16_00745 [Betaproteobacteria bacterium TMED156]|tara:strand:+ start:236 stop:904 length:669 start_codon:yes stop_codon:yes gene_type:complete